MFHDKINTTVVKRKEFQRKLELAKSPVDFMNLEKELYTLRDLLSKEKKEIDNFLAAYGILNSDNQNLINIEKINKKNKEISKNLIELRPFIMEITFLVNFKYRKEFELKKIDKINLVLKNKIIKEELKKEMRRESNTLGFELKDITNEQVKNYILKKNS